MEYVVAVAFGFFCGLLWDIVGLPNPGVEIWNKREGFVWRWHW